MDAYHRYTQSIRWLEQFDSTGRTTQFMKSRSHPERYITRTRLLLTMLGNPDKAMSVIHVTGTAGKGTVSTMVHNGLWMHGTTVGLFTSPYCVTVAENIQVNGRLIAPNEFADLVDIVRPVVKAAYRASPSDGPSYFEILLAIALLYFQQKRCGWVVLEVGLGGRYDATNVIEDPVVSAITNIGMDHTNILGPTLRHIARDKAGIIKSGCTFFTTEHRNTLLRLFHRACQAHHATFIGIERGKSAQESNERLATAILEYLHIPLATIERGIRQTRLPCRFEVVDHHPTIILDGAHNPLKISALLERLQKMRQNKLIVVLGMLADKDTQRVVAMLSRVTSTIIFTRGTHVPMPGRSWAQWPKQKKSPYRALDRARSIARADDTIVVTGSFYLVGELREHWFSERDILKRRSVF